jgi:hypothetical protein
MQSTEIQFKSEETEVKDILMKMGVSVSSADQMISAIKNKNAEGRLRRNEALRETAILLKGIRSGLRPWFVHDLLSKLSGLTVNTIQRICLSVNPITTQKNGTKN